MRAMNAGFDLHLVKPVSASDLVRTLDECGVIESPNTVQQANVDEKAREV